MTTKLCYVIMPFSKTRSCTEDEWTAVFEELIRPAVENAGLGYQCRRSEATTGSLIKAIITSLDNANVVIADLTDQNPNVFYELGVRHSLQNRTILIAQKRSHIPSDLRDYASHVYRWKTAADKAAFRKKMKALLSGLNEDPDRPDNPVADFLADKSRPILAFEHEQHQRYLKGLLREIELARTVLKVQLNHVRKDGSVHRFSIPTPAIDFLLATSYVTHEYFVQQASSIRGILALIDSRSVDKEIAQEADEALAVFEVNTDQVLSALASGDFVENLKLDELPK